MKGIVVPFYKNLSFFHLINQEIAFNKFFVDKSGKNKQETANFPSLPEIKARNQLKSGNTAEMAEEFTISLTHWFCTLNLVMIRTL